MSQDVLAISAFGGLSLLAVGLLGMVTSAVFRLRDPATYACGMVIGLGFLLFAASLYLADARQQGLAFGIGAVGAIFLAMSFTNWHWYRKQRRA